MAAWIVTSHRTPASASISQSIRPLSSCSTDGSTGPPALPALPALPYPPPQYHIPPPAHTQCTRSHTLLRARTGKHTHAQTRIRGPKSTSYRHMSRHAWATGWAQRRRFSFRSYRGEITEEALFGFSGPAKGYQSNSFPSAEVHSFGRCSCRFFGCCRKLAHTGAKGSIVVINSHCGVPRPPPNPAWIHLCRAAFRPVDSHLELPCPFVNSKPSWWAVHGASAGRRWLCCSEWWRTWVAGGLVAAAVVAARAVVMRVHSCMLGLARQVCATRHAPREGRFAPLNCTNRLWHCCTVANSIVNSTQ
jgi:hypothetical protein